LDGYIDFANRRTLLSSFYEMERATCKSSYLATW
jgi:hypothetical protein